MGISMGISIIWDFSMGFARILWEYLWEYYERSWNLASGHVAWLWEIAILKR